MKSTREFISKIYVDVFENVKKSSTPAGHVSLYNWLLYYPSLYKGYITEMREINKTNPVFAKECKAKLPLASISAKFDHRKADDVKELHNIIAIDIDKADNEHIKNWNAVKHTVARMKGVFYTSLSCRGEGIYCLVNYKEGLDFTKVWYALEEDFKRYNINIDKNCKDITRLRFISYDDSYILTECIEEYDKEKEIVNNCEQEINFGSSLNTDDIFTLKAIFYLIKECGYRANDYNSWLKDGFRLATFEKYGKILFMYLSSMSAKYNERYAAEKFENCLRNTKNDKSSLAYYFGKLKSILGPDWKNIIYSYHIELPEK